MRALYGIIASSLRLQTPVNTGLETADPFMLQVGGFDEVTSANLDDGGLGRQFNLFDVGVDSHGGIYLVGQIQYPASENALGWDSLIVKYAPDGSFLWQKSFSNQYTTLTADNTNVTIDNGVITADTMNGRHSGYDCAYALAIHNDKIYVVGESQDNPITGLNENNDSYVACFSPAGNCLWHETYNIAQVINAVTTATGNWFNDVLVVNGAIYAAGGLRRTVNGNDMDQMVLVQLDLNNGNLNWYRLIGDPAEILKTNASTLSSDGSGSLYVTSAVSQVDGGTTTNQVLVVKYNSFGALQWTTGFDMGQGFYDQPEGVTTPAGESYAVVGLWDDTLLVAKFGTDGSMQWLKNVRLASDAGPSDWYYELSRSKLVIHPSGDLIISAFCTAYETAANYLIRIDGTGALVSTRVMTDGGDHHSEYHRAGTVIVHNSWLYLVSNLWDDNHKRGSYSLISTVEMNPVLGSFSSEVGIIDPAERAFKVQVVNSALTHVDPVAANSLGPPITGISVVTGGGLVFDNMPTGDGDLVPTILTRDVLVTTSQWLLLYGQQSAAYDQLEFWSGVADPSGNLIATGYLSNDAVVVKFDPTGAVLWAKTQNIVANEGQTVCCDSSGNIYTATTNFSSGVCIQKLDANGNLLWANTLADPTNHGLYYTIASMKIHGSTLYLYGHHYINNDLKEQAALYQVNTSTGAITIQWEMGFGGTPIGQPNDEFNGLVIQADGTMIFAGCTGSMGVGSLDNFIMKMSASGHIQWQRVFGAPTGTNATGLDFAVGLVSDGTYHYVVGSTCDGPGPVDIYQYRMFIAKYDDSGTLQWTRQYSNPKFGIGLEVTYGQPVVLLNNHIYVRGTWNSAAVVMKFDLEGNIIWARTFRQGGGDGTNAYDIMTDGTNLFLVGSILSDTYAGYILKFDENGPALGIQDRFFIEDFELNTGTVNFTESAAIFNDPAVATNPVTTPSVTVTDVGRADFGVTKIILSTSQKAPTPGAVTFSGGLDLFNPALQMTNSGYVAISFWTRIPDIASRENTIFYAANPQLPMGYLTWMAPYSGGGNDGMEGLEFGNYEPDVNSFSEYIGSDPVPLNQWVHYLAVFKSDTTPTPNGIVLYRNRQKVGAAGRNYDPAFIPNLAGYPFYVGSDGYHEAGTFDMAEYWLDVGHDFMLPDGTVSSATLDKFVTSDLKPANLGQSGELPTGKSPVIYLHKDTESTSADDFMINLGTGGAFTVSGGDLAIALTNPDGTTYTPPPPPPAPSPKVVVDFKNGVYSIGGVSKTLDEVVALNATYGPYSTSDIVSGTGLTASNGGRSLPVLTTAAQTALLTNGVNGGYSAVVKFNIASMTNFSSLGVELVNAASTDGWGAQAALLGASNGSSLYDYNTLSKAIPLSTQGEHVLSVTLKSGRLSGCMDGGAVQVASGTMQTSDPTAIVGIWIYSGAGGTATIESVEFYETVTDAVLPTLPSA